MFEAFVSRTRTTTKCFEEHDARHKKTRQNVSKFVSLSFLFQPCLHLRNWFYFCVFFTCWIRILRVNPDLAEAGSETLLRSNFDSKRHLILLIPMLAPDLNICIHLFGIHLAIRFYVSLEPEVCLWSWLVNCSGNLNSSLLNFSLKTDNKKAASVPMNVLAASKPPAALQVQLIYWHLFYLVFFKRAGLSGMIVLASIFCKFFYCRRLHNGKISKSSFFKSKRKTRFGQPKHDYILYIWINVCGSATFACQNINTC